MDASERRDNMDEPERLDPKTEERERGIANIVLLLAFVAVVGIGIWLVNVMFDQSKIDDCAAQGRRNCAPIDAPAR
jgi:hypothetical protein